MFGVIEHVGRSLIDRRHARARGRIGLGASMDRKRVETWRALIAHGSLLAIVKARKVYLR